MSLTRMISSRPRFENRSVNDLIEILPIALCENSDARAARSGVRGRPSLSIFSRRTQAVPGMRSRFCRDFLPQTIALARESLFNFEIGITALNHGCT